MSDFILDPSHMPPAAPASSHISDRTKLVPTRLSPVLRNALGAREGSVDTCGLDAWTDRWRLDVSQQQC